MVLQGRRGSEWNVKGLGVCWDALVLWLGKVSTMSDAVMRENDENDENDKNDDMMLSPLVLWTIVQSSRGVFG